MFLELHVLGIIKLGCKNNIVNTLKGFIQVIFSAYICLFNLLSLFVAAVRLF